MSASVRVERDDARIENDRLSAEVASLRTALEGLPEQIAQAIETTLTDPERKRPSKGPMLTDFLTDDEWCAAIARSFAASRPTPAPGDVDLQIAAAVLDGAARSFTPAPQETPKETQR